MTPYVSAYANLITNYCLDIKPNETVVIKATPLAEPLLQHLYEALLKKGAHVHFDLSFAKQSAIFYEHASDDLLNSVSPLTTQRLANIDASVRIHAPYDTRELDHVPSEKKQRQAKAMADYKKTFMQRSAAGDLRWCLCDFPTESLAKESGMTLEEHQAFVAKACFLTEPDPVACWQALSDMQAKLVTFLNTKKHLHLKGPNGTDLKLSVAGRTWINSDGKRNMPSGEVFTSPVEDSVEGEVYFSVPTLYQGASVRGVRLVFRQGKVVEFSAEEGQDALASALGIDGAKVLGEIGIGTNTNITQFTRNILFDEKVAGTIHLAIGASYPETGGKNVSALHWDLITEMQDGGEIFADGECCYRDGAFLN